MSAWTGVAKWHTTEKAHVQLGACQVNPRYVNDGYKVRKGLDPNFPDCTTGTLVPLEFGFTPAAVARLRILSRIVPPARQ